MCDNKFESNKIDKCNCNTNSSCKCNGECVECNCANESNMTEEKNK